MNLILKNGIILCLSCLITSCSVTPKPISVQERLNQAKIDLHQLFAIQEKPQSQLNFNEALARGLKYNLDYRIKLVNTALQAGQLKIAMFTMFPALNVSGSVYSRDNEYATKNITTTGQSTDTVSPTPNTLRSIRTGLTWNVLDFGVGYIRAKQQGERINIAEEESRKQLQQLSQDILVAYWSAYSAQQLMKEAKAFQHILSGAKNKLSAAMLDPTVPKETILNYQASLLEGNRRIIQLQYKYDKAMIDLKRLINLSLNETFTLAPPPVMLRKAHDLSQLDFQKLDAVTLVNRPELRGQNYQEHIAKLGINTVILQALPGMTLNYGWNYNSNQFLVNRFWMDKSMDMAWNLLNLASLPATFDAAKTQIDYEKLKLMALTFTVLTQTRYAYSRYESLRNEYEVAHKQSENAQALYQLNKNRHLASLASDQQVIIAKLRTLTTKMDEDLLLSELSTALGELYLSVGTDILPLDLDQKSLKEVAEIINKNFDFQRTWDFSEYINTAYSKIFEQEKMVDKSPIVASKKEGKNLIT